MTVAELRARMSNKEWVDWQAYNIIIDQREQIAAKRHK